MRRLWRVYFSISKAPRTVVWCLIYPRNWWWILMLMQILRDCGYMEIHKTLFVLGVELFLWYLFPIVLYCGCQNYRHRLLFLRYILIMWYCLILLEHRFPWKVLSSKWLKTWELIVRSWSFSSSNVYENNNGSIVVATSPRTDPISNHIAVKYHLFRHDNGKEFVIQNIDSENQKADIFIKGLQGWLFVRIRKLLCGW